MLVLKRQTEDGKNRVLIGDDIEIILLEAGPGFARLGFVAPSDVMILRSELKGREDHERDIPTTD